MSAAPSRPALRYHGGKWRIAPWVTGYFPPHRVFTDCYAGAASILFRKQRCYSEVLNDRDDEVVNVHRVLRDPAQAQELERLLRLTPYSRTEWAAAYEPTDDPVERARRAIARSFMGFGSDSVWRQRRTGFRSNSNRSGTTAAVDWARYPDQVRLFTDRLQGVLIECGAALEVLLRHDGLETLHYVDPPYPRSTRSGHKQSYRFEMTDPDHVELGAVLRGLTGYVVLSGYDCPLYRELVGDWYRAELPVTVFRSKRATECLWLNPRASSRLSQQTLFH